MAIFFLYSHIFCNGRKLGCRGGWKTRCCNVRRGGRGARRWCVPRGKYPLSFRAERNALRRGKAGRRERRRHGLSAQSVVRVIQSVIRVLRGNGKGAIFAAALPEVRHGRAKAPCFRFPARQESRQAACCTGFPLWSERRAPARAKQGLATAHGTQHIINHKHT